MIRLCIVAKLVPLKRLKETTGQTRTAPALKSDRIFETERWNAYLQSCMDAARTPGQKRGIKAALDCSRIRLILREDFARVHVLPLRCRKKWCLPCAKEWSLRAWKALAERAKRIPGREFLHLVLTVRNPPPEKLPQTFSHLWQALNLWRRYGKRKTRGEYLRNIKGMVAKIEVSNGEIPGRCHPHLHILLHAQGDFDFSRNSAAWREWQSAIKHYSGADAPVTWIKRGEDGRDMQREVMKYCTKPILDESCKPAIFAKIIEAMAGRRMLFSYGSLEFSIRDDPQGIWSLEGTIETVLAKAEQSQWITERAFYVWLLGRLARHNLLEGLAERMNEFLELPFSKDGKRWLADHGGKPPDFYE